jgi:hypothetical protein
MDLSTLTKGLKETAVGEFGKWLAGKWGLENQGVMDTFKIDTENKIFDITLKLKDREEPVDLKINYSLETQDGKDVLILTPVKGSSEWLDQAIDNETVKNFFDKPIEIPALVSPVIKHFL